MLEFRKQNLVFSNVHMRGKTNYTEERYFTTLSSKPVQKFLVEHINK